MALAKCFRTAPKFWERRGPTSLLLWPLSWLYSLVLRLRKLVADLGIFNPKPFGVPVIIVGNIRVGGTGKTPIVIALAEKLQVLGWHPGIISRGYGAMTTVPTAVTSQSNSSIVGDEPVLIAKRTSDQFPVWVYPKRAKAIAALLKSKPAVNVIISDDGLQHTGLARWPAREGGRDIELVVRDERGEGNQFLLPAGPLREPSERERDATLITSDRQPKLAGIKEYFQGRRLFTLKPCLGLAYQLNKPDITQSLENLAEQYPAKKNVKQITAVAALGNPKRFFDAVQKHGVIAKQISLPDHSTYGSDFFKAIHTPCILMTEKDAVKCTGITDERIWVVPMSISIPDDFSGWMQAILQRPDPNQYTL